MISSTEVSVILIIIWGSFYLFFQKKMGTIKVYFVILLLMALGGLMLPEKYMWTPGLSYAIFNIVAFAIVILIGLIPWFYFQQWFSQIDYLHIKNGYIKGLKIVFNVLILWFIYSLIYAFPYVLKTMSMNAAEVRNIIAVKSLYPASFFTTICVGIGYLAPIQIIFVFLSLIEKKLRSYTIPLILVSFSQIYVNLPNAGRDGFIYISILYLVFYIMFRKFLPKPNIKKLKKLTLRFMPILIILLLSISIDRFYNGKSQKRDYTEIVRGTWGYIYQQPHVFDQNVQDRHNFTDIDRTFPILSLITGKKIEKGKRILRARYDWSFGTMYKAFYNAGGWGAMFGITIFFVLSFVLTLKFTMSRKNFSGTLLIFSIYLYLMVSGLFYFRLKDISVTLLFLFLIGYGMFSKDIFVCSRNPISKNEKY